MKFKLLTLAGFLIASLIILLPANSAAEQLTTIADLILAGSDFAAGSGEGYEVAADGLTLSETALSGFYTSAVLEAPIPYNAVVPQWTAEVPDLADMEIKLRTAKSQDAWSDWYDIHMQPDWMLPEDSDIVGEMITVPAADLKHNYVQFSIRFQRAAGTSSPVLSQLHLTFIDSTAGPTVEQMIAQQSALDAAAPELNTAAGSSAYPRPVVISRQVWCTDPDCNYTDGLAYEPATHMVVHHTVSANENSDWAAVVRAIWRFHTYTRQWGDIGYNYLIDREGVTYEGHNSQDYLNLDVIGTHAADANAGGMGVALIGTFTTPEEYPVSDAPPQPMLEAAAQLLAWKAAQRNIDVYGASRMVNTSWGLPHLMGHRDVYGGTATTCPGGQAYALLPWLRDRVAELIGFESPYIYVDELSEAFTMSNPSLYWWTGPRGCGHNGHSYYTWSVTSPGESTNWGEWRPAVPASGRYEIEAYAPYCDTGESETKGATYQITHANGVDQVVVSQNDHIGLWMSLGEFDLLGGNSTVVRLTDLTSTDSGKGVWFDAIRLRPLSPTAANHSPAPDTWLNQRQVAFSWKVSSPGAVLTTALQVASDAAFNNMVLERSWATGGTTSYLHTFDRDYAALYWRVTITFTSPESQAVGQFTSPATSFGLDATAPESAVTKILQLPHNRGYVVVWDGSDQLSALATYSVDFRLEGDGTWVRWLTDTTLTNSIFTPADPTQVYWLRTQSIDRAGNIEPASEIGDMSTAASIVLAYDIMLPVVNR